MPRSRHRRHPIAARPAQTGAPLDRPRPRTDRRAREPPRSWARAAGARCRTQTAARAPNPSPRAASCQPAEPPRAPRARARSYRRRGAPRPGAASLRRHGRGRGLRAARRARARARAEPTWETTRSDDTAAGHTAELKPGGKHSGFLLVGAAPRRHRATSGQRQRAQQAEGPAVRRGGLERRTSGADRRAGSRQLPRPRRTHREGSRDQRVCAGWWHAAAAPTQNFTSRSTTRSQRTTGSQRAGARRSKRQSLWRRPTPRATQASRSFGS